MKRFFYWLLCLSLLAGCGKDKDKDISEPDEPEVPETPTVVTLELSEADLIFEAEGGQKTFTITCNTNWTITNESNWCTTDVTSGTGNRTITVKTQSYGELEDRTMNLTIKAGDKTQVLGITQKGKDAIVPDKAKFEVPQEGGELAVKVRSNVTYEVTIPESFHSWIQPAPETRAEMSDTTYRFIISENESDESRTGYILFSAASVQDTVRIFQAQKDRLVLTQTKYSLFKEDTTITVELKTNVDYEVRIEGDAASWISRVETRASRVDRLQFRIEGNTDNISREGKILFKDKNGDLADTVHVAQYGKVYRGDIVFKAKQELIDFQATGNTGIIGNVIVQGTGLKTLQELGNLLVEIDGNLTLECDGLESLEGLGKLKRITGNLVITKGKMATLDGLDDLESIGGDFELNSSSAASSSNSSSYSLSSLKSFEGLENLESIGGSFKVISFSSAFSSPAYSYSYSYSLSSLKSFKGLSKLKSIGGSFKVISSSSSHNSSSSSFSSSLNALKSFEGLENLESIGGDFELKCSSGTGVGGISSSWNLSSFKGLEGLERIGGNFKLISASSATASKNSSFGALVSFVGLNKLRSIGGDFEVNSSSYSSSQAYASSSSSSSSSLNAFKSFKGLESLECIGGSFKVVSSSESTYNWCFSSSSSLGSLKFTGLSKLRSIGRDFEVNSLSSCRYAYSGSPSSSYSGSSSSLNSLEFFEGLENLESIGGNFKVNSSSFSQYSSLFSSSLKFLRSFLGLEKLNTVQNISITGCRALYDFCALKNVVEISDCGFETEDNGYNPTKDALLNGNCSASK